MRIIQLLCVYSVCLRLIPDLLRPAHTPHVRSSHFYLILHLLISPSSHLSPHRLLNFSSFPPHLLIIYSSYPPKFLPIYTTSCHKLYLITSSSPPHLLPFYYSSPTYLLDISFSSPHLLWISSSIILISFPILIFSSSYLPHLILITSLFPPETKRLRD